MMKAARLAWAGPMEKFFIIIAHGRMWSPFHLFPGKGWRRSQNGVGHKMRREKKNGKKKKRGKRKKGREKKGKKEEKEAH